MPAQSAGTVVRATLVAALASLAAALAACGGPNNEAGAAAGNDTTANGEVAEPAASFQEVKAVTGFQGPESAIYDASQKLWFVSNVNGQPAEKDHNGFISRVRPDGTIDSLKFIASGRDGVTLDAPKGLALTGDTLWVADIDVVRAFNATTGAPITAVDLSGEGAKFLNGVAVAPDQGIYITDTGLEAGTNGQTTHAGPDRIFKINQDGTPSIALQSDSLRGPNGITWDSENRRFIVASFAGPTVLGWNPLTANLKVITTGPGQFDGADRLSDGRTLITSWADSSLYVLEGGNLTKVTAGGLPSPADLHADAAEDQVAIPLLLENRVEIYSIPPGH